MKRVIVLGRGGAGKSSFARRLGNTTGIPVVELDKHFWPPDLTPIPRAQWSVDHLHRGPEYPSRVVLPVIDRPATESHRTRSALDAPGNTGRCSTSRPDTL